MARFTLAVRPDGKAILTTTAALSESDRVHVMEVIRGWEAGAFPVLLIADCETVQVAELEIDLEPVKPAS